MVADFCVFRLNPVASLWARSWMRIIRKETHENDFAFLTES
jgi:hypothetical protein